MAINVKLNQTGHRIKATVNDQQDIRIKSSSFVSRSIDDLVNTDTSNLKDGSVLVYKENTNKWTSTITLDAQNLEGGEF